MSWTTVYISGRSDFRQEVRRKLDHASIPSMPGFIESHMEQKPCDLYWLDGTVSMRTFKEAIGGKLIWKHRLRFFTTLEEFMAAQQKPMDTSFTDHERDMINEMRAAS